MDVRRVTATFQDKTDAERAYNWLVENGVKEDDIAVLAADEAAAAVSAGKEERSAEAKDVGSDAAKGAAAGAGVGALFGLAALAIPGIGPFIAGGWLASALGATAGALASGAIVGGTAGSLAGALTNIGYSRDEADRYAEDIQSGATLISVNMPSNSPVDADEVYDAFHEMNGRMVDR